MKLGPKLLITISAVPTDILHNEVPLITFNQPLPQERRPTLSTSRINRTTSPLPSFLEAQRHSLSNENPLNSFKIHSQPRHYHNPPAQYFFRMQHNHTPQNAQPKLTPLLLHSDLSKAASTLRSPENEECVCDGDTNELSQFIPW